MNAFPLKPAAVPRPDLETLIARHGAARVLWALLRALLNPRRLKRGRPRPPDPAHLGAHLRRDIGLPPHDPRPPRYYDLM